MSRLVPGPCGDERAWARFHRALVKELHHHPTLLGCTQHGEGWARPAMRMRRALWRVSPWTCGACNTLAVALAVWINDGVRVRQWVLGDLRPAYDEPDLWHTIVSYDSDAIGRVWFDGVAWTRNRKVMEELWEQPLHPVTKYEMEHMMYNFAGEPTRSTVNIIVTHLTHALGHWPKGATSNCIPMPWDIDPEAFGGLRRG